MFGYFRFLNQYSDYRAQAVYKNYYCGLCFALDMHYGALSRMLLSYDVTILAIALHAHSSPECDKLKCIGYADCKKPLFQNELWKKIAAVNILLAAEKMSDDITDERSLKASVGAFFYKGIIKKAAADYPQIRTAIRNGYAAIVTAEKEDRDVLQIGELFGDLMVGILEAGFTVSEVTKTYIREISRWLYFIDALDDYDEDLKKHRFNPIAEPELPSERYFLQRYRQLQDIIENLYRQHDCLIEQLDDGSPENDILISVLKNSIPAVTALVMNRYELPKLLHCKSGNIWRTKA